MNFDTPAKGGYLKIDIEKDTKRDSRIEVKREVKRGVENREYRSDVFSMLMEYSEYALSVYNSLNNTNYDDPDLVEMKTLEKGISLSVRNDAAFVIGTELNIYEHQSSYNPNMPLRALLYLVEILKPLLKSRDIYGSTLIKIPTPHFVVFYNGKDNREEKEILKLSDAYEHSENEINLEVICTVYNINPENNSELMKKCSVLQEYTQFVEKVKENINNGMEDAISLAIDYCIKHNILREFLESRRDEVIKNMTIDMTFERRLELSGKEHYEAGISEGIELGRSEGIELGRSEGIELGRSEGIEQGRSEGIELGRSEGIALGRSEGRHELCQALRQLVIDNELTAKAAAKQLNITEEEFSKLL